MIKWCMLKHLKVKAKIMHINSSCSNSTIAIKVNQYWCLYLKINEYLASNPPSNSSDGRLINLDSVAQIINACKSNTMMNNAALINESIISNSNDYNLMMMITIANNELMIQLLMLMMNVLLVIIQ
jgi:hydrogenase maturation factor HypF (carbamoyltransferase family)